jgi:polyprenyl-phospho-N-acetylgalactosaminyl synthase
LANALLLLEYEVVASIDGTSMPPCADTRRLTWIVIPAYNEASVIGSVVADVCSAYPNVVVIDDGSSDDTGIEALKAGASLVTHAINLGQGAALKTGIHYVLQRDAKYIVTFDADGQHSIDDVDTMFDVMNTKGCDVVLGSRFCGTTENLPRMRRLVLWLAIMFTRRSTGLNLTDTHNGLRLLSVDAAKRIGLQQNGMAHASELLEQIARHDISYSEAPVNIRYTDYSLQKGQKLSNSIGILLDLIVRRFVK